MPRPPTVDEFMAALDHPHKAEVHPRRPLDGSYPDRRLVYFHSLDDVAAKQGRLEAAIREWIAIKDRPDA